MAVYDLMIRGGSVVSQGKVEAADLAVKDGKIAAVGPNLTGSALEEIDASGKTLLPGGFDCHVHFNEPGHTDWETLATGTAALAAGGMTSFADMPLNSLPVVTDGEAFDLKLAAAGKSCITDYALYGGLVPGKIDKMPELAERGVVGFKAFTCFSGLAEFEGADDDTLYHGMEMAAKLGLPLSIHCENGVLIDGFTKRLTAQGKTGALDFVDSRPPITEIEPIGKVIALAKATGCALHIAHVSTWEGVELVAQARADGYDVTCETVPQYLTLRAEELPEIGPLGKCCPPLRYGDNLERLWERLREGKIQMVCSDHSPAPAELKRDPNFFKVWGGISGCQSTLNTLLDGCAKGWLTLSQAAALIAENPAKRFRLPGKGALAVGYDADVAIVDMEASFTLRSEDLHYLHKVSPVVGRTFQGKVCQTLLRGVTIFRDGHVYPGATGRFLRPAEQ